MASTGAAAHPYFVAKARAVLARAGGDAEAAGPLGIWASEAREAVRNGDHAVARDRVVVARDGTILAVARSHRGRVSASYVRSVSDEGDIGEVGRELGLAIGAFRRRSGQDVIVVTYSEVCMGTAPAAERAE